MSKKQRIVEAYVLASAALCDGRSALMCAVIVEGAKRTVSCLPGLCTARGPLEEGLPPGIYSSGFGTNAGKETGRMTIAVTRIGPLQLGCRSEITVSNLNTTWGRQQVGRGMQQHSIRPPIVVFMVSSGLMRLKKSIHKSVAKHFQEQVLGD